ncbi:MAG: hypothetical protein VXW29_02010 [SAR324 cluster bacterium]|nr:hypothetical protein [SAR324 cluster bacterium]
MQWASIWADCADQFYFTEGRHRRSRERRSSMAMMELRRAQDGWSGALLLAGKPLAEVLRQH